MAISPLQELHVFDRQGKLLQITKAKERKDRAKSESENKETFQANLIEVNDKVRVVSQPGWLNYLPVGGGQPSTAFNTGRVQERNGTPVIVGFIDDQPSILRIDQTRIQDGKYNDPLFAMHAGTSHQWGGGDPYYLDPRAVAPLMVRPVQGALKVKVTPGPYGFLGKYSYFPGTVSYDLSTLQPATGTKVGIGLYVDVYNDLQTVSGSTVAQTMPAPDPVWLSSMFPLAKVILYGDQAYVDFEDIKVPVQGKILHGHDGQTLYNIAFFG